MPVESIYHVIGQFVGTALGGPFAPTSGGVALAPSQGGCRGERGRSVEASVTLPRFAWQAQ